MPTTKQGNLAKALLAEYPTAGNLTLAKRLHRDYPEYYETVEHARTVIRYYKGEQGKRNRKDLGDLTHVKDLDKVLADKFALPDAAIMQREKYIIPKINDRGIVIGDGHFPYQHNKTIYSAVEFGVKKSVNFIVLNGDWIDNYQISRYLKDGRKPNVEYDIELFYQFLIDLRATFSNALIIWKFGNHEERWDNYLKVNAPLLDMIGTIGIEDYIPVKELGIQVVRDKRLILCGDLNIAHGHEFGSGAGNVNPARAMFLKAKANILVNHFHRSSSHKEKNINGDIIKTYSLGSACSDQDYMPYGNQDHSFGFLQVVDGKTYVTNWEV